MKLVENIKYNRLIFVLRPNKFSASFHAKTCNFFSFYQACRSQVLNTVWTEILVKKVSTSIRKSVASSLQNPKLQKWVASSDISRLWPNCLELSRLLKTVETLGQTVKTFRGKCWQGSTIDTHGLKIQGRGSRLSGKITSGVPYFGFYCIFINMCLNLPGGGPIFTLSPPPPLYESMGSICKEILTVFKSWSWLWRFQSQSRLRQTSDTVDTTSCTVRCLLVWSLWDCDKLIALT